MNSESQKGKNKSFFKAFSIKLTVRKNKCAMLNIHIQAKDLVRATFQREKTFIDSDKREHFDPNQLVWLM